MKTTVYIGTSLDGFVARKDGNIDWLVKFANQEVNDSYNEFISTIDAIVKGFSNIYVDGGTVIQSFLKEDCIDELIITKLPVLIGSGISLFGPLDGDLQFEHLQTKVYSNGLVMSHYARRRTEKEQ